MHQLTELDGLLWVCNLHLIADNQYENKLYTQYQEMLWDNPKYKLPSRLNGHIRIVLRDIQ